MVASVLCLSLTVLFCQAPASPPAAEAAWLKVVPADTELIVRTRGLEAARNDLVKMLEAMSPLLAEQAKVPLDQVLTQLAGQYGQAATKEPFLVIVRLPNDQNPPAFAVLIKSDDYAGVQKSIAGGDAPKVTAKPGGYDEFAAPMDKKIFTHKGNGFVSFSEDESLVAAVAKPKQSIDSAFNDELRASFFSGDLSIYANLTVIQKRFGDAIDGVRQQFLAALDQAPAGNENMRGTVKSVYGALFDAIKSGEGLALSFDFDAAGLTLAAHATAKPDAPAAKTLAMSRPTAPTLITRLPANGVAYMDFNVGDEQLNALSKWGMNMMLGSGGKLSPDFEKAMERYFKASAGEMATASKVAEGVQSVAITIPRSPKEAVDAYKDAMNALANTKDRGATEMIKAVKLDPKALSYKGYDFYKAELTYDLEKLAQAQPNNPGGLEAARKMLGGEKVSIWFGTDGKTMLTFAGQSWEKVQPAADAVIGGSAGVSKSAGYASTRKLLPENANFLLLVSAQGLTKQIADQTAGALGRKVPEPDLPKETVFLGASVTGTPHGYQFKFVLPSAAGPVIQQGVMPLLGGVAQ